MYMGSLANYFSIIFWVKHQEFIVKGIKFETFCKTFFDKD